MVDAAAIAGRAIAACGDDAEEHLRIDLRPDRVLLALQDRATSVVTRIDVDLAAAITDELGGATPDVGGHPRAVQAIEIGIDALNIPAVRPFWKAVLDYVDEPDGNGLLDPDRQGPSVWFQQMDAPRPQRNRIHLDVSVPHDEARRRLAAGLAAGGTLIYDAEAPSFWVLADAEGNEACVCSWEGRDAWDEV
jgi:4a-hydroxytetrahydrobiopterin dehydratase